MEIALIAAMANNRVIGINNTMPWHLPDDFAHFKRLTLNHPIIMGRKTYESIGRPLPSRKNIIISRNASFKTAGAEVFATLQQAVAAASNPEGMPEDVCNTGGSKAPSRIFIIGGGALYTQALPLAQRMYLTQVNVEISGDTWFPKIDPAQWREVSHTHHASDAKHAYAFDFVEFERQNLLHPTQP